MRSALLSDASIASACLGLALATYCLLLGELQGAAVGSALSQRALRQPPRRLRRLAPSTRAVTRLSPLTRRQIEGSAHRALPPAHHPEALAADLFL